MHVKAIAGEIEKHFVRRYRGLYSGHLQREPQTDEPQQPFRPPIILPQPFLKGSRWRLHRRFPPHDRRDNRPILRSKLGQFRLHGRRLNRAVTAIKCGCESRDHTSALQENRAGHSSYCQSFSGGKQSSRRLQKQQECHQRVPRLRRR